jgi:hypothetical protein
MGWSLNDVASTTEVTASHEIETITHGMRFRTQLALVVAYF